MSKIYAFSQDDNAVGSRGIIGIRNFTRHLPAAAHHHGRLNGGTTGQLTDRPESLQGFIMLDSGGGADIIKDLLLLKLLKRLLLKRLLVFQLVSLLEFLS